MDELHFLISRRHIRDPAVRKEVNITYEMKDAGKLIFEVQSLEIDINIKNAINFKISASFYILQKDVLDF